MKATVFKDFSLSKISQIRCMQLTKVWFDLTKLGLVQKQKHSLFRWGGGGS
jgi:hypothetical protein